MISLNILLEIIADFARLKREIYNTFLFEGLFSCADHSALHTIQADKFLWDFYFHGSGVCFKRKTRHRITIEITDKNDWSGFDAWTLKTYIGTKKKRVEEREIARLDHTELLKYLLMLCEQGDSGVSKHAHKKNEFVYSQFPTQ